MTNDNPHCVINGECLRLQTKKYQIKIWHMAENGT
jgi:hypothetical protein